MPNNHNQFKKLPHAGMLPNAIVDAYLAPADPHEQNRIEGFGIIAFVVSLIALIIEAWVVYAAVQEQISIATGILLHLVISGLLVFAFVLFSAMQNNRLFLGLLAIATFAAGPFGAGGTVVSMLLWLWYSRFSTQFADWFDTIFPSPVISEAEAVDEDLRTGRDEAARRYDVEPFMDVLRFGTDDQKRRALSKITSAFTPGFASALRLALRDDSNMIRVQAATAISIIENRIQKRLYKLTNLYRQRPEEPAVILVLANYHDDYSFTGILDDARERDNRVQAKKLYEKYIQLVPEDTAIRTRYGRLLLRMEDYHGAITSFEQATRDQLNPTRVAWLAEAYYRSGRFDRLRQLAVEICTEHRALLANLEGSVQRSFRSWADAGEI